MCIRDRDYSYGINVNASDDEKQAALIFVKWMTEKSGFSYNEDGLPVAKSSSCLLYTSSGRRFKKQGPGSEIYRRKHTGGLT